MATYVFKCPECGHRLERTTPEVREGYCSETGKNVTLVRDYKAEGVAVATVPGAYKATASRG